MYEFYMSDAAYSSTDETWMALARISMLCNRAEFIANQEHLPVLKRLNFLHVKFIWKLPCFAFVVI